VEQEKTTIAKQLLGKHAPAATDAQETLEEPFDAVFGAIFDDYTETAYRTD
jgi:hypothetical protein